MPSSHNYAALLCVALTVLTAAEVDAQTYPNKPIRLLVSAPGGSTDILARFIAPSLSEILHQLVVIDNRGSVYQVEAAYKASPDGYTLMLVGTFPYWIISSLRDNPNDHVIIRDFSPIATIGRIPQVVVVQPSLPVKSVTELIALAKDRPGILNYGSTVPGGTNHLAGEMFKILAGVNIVIVPYKGTGGAVVALLGNEVQIMIPTVSAVLPHIKSGKLRALAITSAQPSTLVPGLPTVAATGLRGYEMEQTLGMFAVRNTPSAIINELNRTIVRVIGRPDIEDKFLSSGAEAEASTPAELGAKVRSEMVRWDKVIKAAGIRADPE